jgi:hypothetical protein
MALRAGQANGIVGWILQRLIIQQRRESGSAGQWSLLAFVRGG